MWLDGSSWEAVLPVLERAGHRAHPRTLPGMESKDADRSAFLPTGHWPHPAVGSGAGEPGKHHFSNCVTIRLALGIMEPNS